MSRRGPAGHASIGQGRPASGPGPAAICASPGEDVQQHSSQDDHHNRHKQDRYEHSRNVPDHGRHASENSRHLPESNRHHRGQQRTRPYNTSHNNKDRHH